MNGINYILIGLTSTYLLFNIIVMYRISKARYLNESRRNIHKVFIWLIPFLGPLMIMSYWLSPEKITVKTKHKRKTEKGSFYESGIGMDA